MPFHFLKGLGEELNQLTKESCLFSNIWGNTSVFINSFLFKWLQSEKDFEALPKKIFHKEIQFKNQAERLELLKLHKEIQALLPIEKAIILGYLCRTNFTYSFLEIAKSFKSSFRQYMPKEYLENCLMRIAIALETKAKFYHELFEPLAQFLGLYFKTEKENGLFWKYLHDLSKNHAMKGPLEKLTEKSESSECEASQAFSIINCCCPFL